MHQFALIISSFQFALRPQETNGLTRKVTRFDKSRFLIFPVLGIGIMCYFQQKNKHAIHSGSGKNGKYPIKHTYVVENKVDDSSIIGRHTNGATKYRFP